MRAKLPSYRRHKPSNRAVVRLNGHDYYLGPYGSKSSKREYDRLIAEWLAHGKRVPEREGLLVGRLIIRYLRWADSYYQSREPEQIRYAFRPLWKLYGQLPVIHFGPLALQVVQKEMVALGWCRRTVNEHLSRIKRMFRWGVAQEMVDPSIYEALRAVPGLRVGRSAAPDRAGVQGVPPGHWQAVLGKVSPEVGAMIQLQLLSGMRPGEVIALRSLDIQMDGKVWAYRPERHKMQFHGKGREVLLGPKAQELIRPFLQIDRSAWLFSPARAEKNRNAGRRKRQAKLAYSPRVRPPGDRYTVRSYRRAIHRACDSAEIPRWSPNRLRHNAATELRRRYGVEMARLLLGHSSGFTTEIYAEADRRQMEKIMLQIG